MDHFSELTYSMYADGELPEPERLRVHRHLAECPKCRAQVEALEVENRVLMEVLRTAEESGAAQARGAIGRSLLITVGSALAVALGLDRLVVAVQRLAPGAVSWMDPISFSWFQSVLFNNALDLVREGPAMLNVLVTVLGFLVLGVVVAGILRHFLSRHPMSLALLAAMLLAVALPRPAAAMKRSGETARVEANETVNESLVATGESIEVDGTVNGNVVAAGHRTVVRGVIKGDLVVFDQETEIAGTVEGSVYSWCQTLTVSGHVGRGVNFWGQSLEIDPSGRVDADVTAGGDSARIRGAVGRDVIFFGGSVDSSGTIGRNLEAYTGSVIVAGSSRIGGNVEAHVKKTQDVDIEPGASIGGKTDITLATKPAGHYSEPKFYFWQAIWMAGALVLGLILYWLAPTFFAARLDSGGSLLRSAGVGFLALVAAPVAVIVACLTLVGIPLGVLLLGLWLAGLWAAKVFVGAAVGRGLVRQRPGESTSFALPLLVGLLMVFVAINLPYVGGWLTFLIILVGLGLAVLGVRSGLKHRPVTP